MPNNNVDIHIQKMMAKASLLDKEGYDVSITIRKKGENSYDPLILALMDYMERKQYVEVYEDKLYEELCRQEEWPDTDEWPTSPSLLTTYLSSKRRKERLEAMDITIETKITGKGKLYILGNT